MILDTVRLVADWLGDATYGVQAKLNALDLDGSDSVPAGTLAIIDETRSDDAAIGRDGTPPFLRVRVGEVRSFDGEAAMYTHDADVPLELLLVRDATSPAAGVRDVYYTLRACLQTIEALLGTSAAATTARTRNGVQCYAITALSASPVRDEIGDRLVSAVVYLTVRCRDTLA